MSKATTVQIAEDEDFPFKDQPNQDEYFLGTQLGLTVDPITHLKLIGKVSKAELGGMCHTVLSHVAKSIEYSGGWAASDLDRQYHPNGDAITRCVCKWDHQGTKVDKTFLRTMAPNQDVIDQLDVAFVSADFVGFHDDEELAEEKNRGVIAVLLNAPYGCKLITNGRHETIAEVGGVYLLDDLNDHAVFPTQEMPKTEYAKIRSGSEHEYREHFTRNMAMSFLIIGHYYQDVRE